MKSSGSPSLRRRDFRGLSGQAHCEDRRKTLALPESSTPQTICLPPKAAAGAAFRLSNRVEDTTLRRWQRFGRPKRIPKVHSRTTAKLKPVSPPCRVSANF